MSNKKELNKVDINVQFEESPTRINITSGEGIKTLFGKIRKYFSDLHSVAFSGSYEDLENKPTIPDISTKMDKENPVGTGSLSIEGNGAFGGKVSVGTDITPTENNDLATKKYVDDNSTIKSIDCTRAEYDAMESHDPDTYYNIIDEDNGLATHEADGLMSKEDKIKLDGMSGGSDPKPVTVTSTVLFDGTLAYNGTVNLAQPISDFDFIMIYTINQYCKAIPTTFFDVKTALEKINEDGYISTFQVANDQFQVSITSYSHKITNNTIIGKGANTTLKVVGIKLST